MVDLGDIDDPVLVFGGPYGNLEATRSVIEAGASAGVAHERMICTGDTVAYGADPRDTVALLREAGIVVVMGNCEESLAAGAADCGCGYAKDGACDTWSVQWFAYCGRQLTADCKHWMGALPRSVTFAVASRRIRVIHGGVGEINRYVFASTAAHLKRTEIAHAEADGVIGGHSGLPFTERIGDSLWHNPGVIGVPANDGTPRVWYSVLSPVGDGIEVVHHSLPYDHEAAARKIRAAPGLPDAYADALESGLWPSLEILPAAERAATGRPLTPTPALWPHRGARR